MACLEIHDVPSGASVDDLGVLVAQFAPVTKLLMLSAGPGAPGSALVWLQPGGDLAYVADALDGHPLAAGLIDVKLCDDPMRWVISRMGDQLLPTPSAQPEATWAAAPAHLLPLAVQQAPAPTAVAQWPAGAGSTAGSTAGGGGVAAMEAELRELQEQLQQQALAGGFDTVQQEQTGHRRYEGEGSAGQGWGGSDAGSGGAEDDGWQQAGGRAGGRRPAGGSGARSSSGGDRSSSGAGGNEIVVHNIDVETTPPQLMSVFKQFGWVNDIAKRRGASCAFLTFQEPGAAAAAIRALHGQVVTALNPGAEVTVEYRTPRSSSKGVGEGQAGGSSSGGSGWATASERPTTKIWAGHIAGHATLETFSRVFSQFGQVFSPELRRAPEAGRRDQWGFVNFRRVEDAQAAFAALRWKVIPDLTGDKPLKLQYRPV